MRVCRRCGRASPADDFLAGKAKRESSWCSTCRRKAAAEHRRRYYAGLTRDRRHTLGAQRRARAAGVEHAEYSREDILRRWNYTCCYCDARAEHLDHVTPLSRGGGDVESNIVPSCAPCNLSKGARTLAEWAESWGRNGIQADHRAAGIRARDE